MGDLDLTIISADNVPIMDFLGRCDPYVEVTAEQYDGTIILRSTSAKTQTLTPAWNECLHFRDLNYKTPLKIDLIDKDKIGKEQIGCFVLDLMQNLPNDLDEAKVIHGEMEIVSKHAVDGINPTIKYKGEITKKMKQ